ncbi:hypothetical protein ACFVYA_23980 [Amycolatopsis sp. NPDC058278]|uniref:hypothetical protein n=1 Tax=Amycolatopsis sp. NPDC058278 TaxID=3346417 RepID=UPI0036DF89C6
MTATRTTARGVFAITDVLLAQVDPADAQPLASVAGVPGGGLVVSGDKEAKMVVRYLRGRGFQQLMLPDRQRYKGRNRLPAAHPFDSNWISWQRDLGLPVIMPDAGYVAATDLNSLQTVLRNSAAIPGAVAPLALANWWLYGVGLRLLLTELAQVSVPIAVIIEHAGDPFGANRILQGLLAVIRSGIPVIPLRCDTSAVGLLAHGALAAAYGGTTALRHLYPQRAGGGGGIPGKESAFWPAGLALHYRDLLHDAVMATPTARRWRCGCQICRGARLDRLAVASTYEVRQHNLACVLDLRHQLVALPAGGDRVRTWSSWCRRGEEEHAAANTSPVFLRVPSALRHWQAAG